MLTRRLLLGVAAMVVLGGCGRETVVHEVDEKQANEIVVLLEDQGIQATKLTTRDRRSVSYSIAVPVARRVEAMRLLGLYELPRRTISGNDGIANDGSIIPTAGREALTRKRALEGEVEKQLLVVAGVLDVQVNISLPEPSALPTMQETRPRPTASVALTYLASPTEKPIAESSVRAAVAASVEGLAPADVVVLMSPREAQAAGSPSPLPKGVFASLSPQLQLGVAVGAILLVMLLGLAVLWMQLRVRAVRQRLSRLQGEIAKARSTRLGAA